MAIVFDAKTKDILTANVINLREIQGPGKLVGFSTGRQNGKYSDIFDGVMQINFDSKNIVIPTSYININSVVEEIIKFNRDLKLSFSPSNTGTLNAFVLFDDYMDVPDVENVITKYIKYSISGGNTYDIPITSNQIIVLKGIMFSEKSNDLLFSIDTNIYNFKDKPTSSIPDNLSNLSVPGDRLIIQLENKSSNSISGVMVVKYGTR